MTSLQDTSFTCASKNVHNKVQFLQSNRSNLCHQVIELSKLNVFANFNHFIPTYFKYVFK